MKIKIIRISIPILKQGIYVCVGPREEAKKWFKKRNISTRNFPETSTAHTWLLDGFWPHVWFNDLRSITTISHELIHACYFIIDDKGIKIGPENHELLTYLQGYAFKEVLKYRRK